MRTYTVSQLAGQTGTTPDTLRYYERIGLLPRAARSPAGHRRYDGDDIDRVRFVKRAQRFRLSLADIAQLLRIREEGACPCGRTRALVQERLGELDAELTELTRLREEMAGMLDTLDTLDGSSGTKTCDGAPIPLTTRPSEGIRS